jgi:hypothetical protein
MAMLSLGAPSASATLIGNLAGAFGDTTPGPLSGFENSISFGSGSAVNDPTGQITGGTYQDLQLLNLTGTSISAGQISGFELLPLAITYPVASAYAGDTITFNFENDVVGPFNSPLATPTSVAFGPFTFYLGVIEASVTSATVVGPDSGTLQPLFNDFNTPADHPTLILTYNGIDLTTAGAAITMASSASFSLVTDPVAVAEPSSAILSLSGAVAIILGKLARQLRKKNSIAWDETPGP